ncbi:MAG: cytochrome b N-terminal domain-containing protein [Rhodanobacteraceae bacterium]|nr:cytochrome b N-terminal domain-containing protein [Rhodanobacteraceae bacterium]
MIRPLQAGLRWLFMHAEALFNRAFGDAHNPLYHLGAIVFWLFWIVAGSGLYLYAFFDTSVVGAYASVESLTHGQWFVGGVLRSVHRYASDAMALLMLIHMLRHFAFDRLRGFRAFSWVTGVGLIWLVYVSGINGYMLPWDRLAQYVIVTSFEWIDWLPGFGGTLIRNFIHPDSVNDRLFSLLSFIHIGAPLLVLLLMWVHVQRVPKAATHPPRAIAIGVVAMLLALSALQPVVSQGGAADLGSEVGTLALDWFYLPIYPLLDRWSPGGVWALVIGITGLLALLPWLRRTRRDRQTRFHLVLHPGPEQVSARPGETLLEAGLRAGLALPYECRNGGCGVCLCKLLNGRVDHGPFQPGTLTPAMRERGETLMCCATPLEDLEIEVPVESLGAAARSAPRQWPARVERLERLGPNVMRVWLSLPGDERIQFAAGQYLNIVLEDGQRRAFSFANPPQDNALIELHIRLIPGGRFTTHVFSEMRVGDALAIEGPLGGFTLHAGDKPILLVAGATGFAPIKSILEDAFARGIQRPMQLYWGVSHPQDLYLLESIERWQREHPNFRFTTVLSEPANAPDWAGRTGMVHQAMLQDHPDLGGFEVYLCGSVKMVDSALPDFLAHGLGPNACFTDAFHPAATVHPTGG